MRRPRRRRESGLTILEVLISMGLFLIAATAALGAQLAVGWSNRYAAERAAAQALISQKIGWLQAQPYTTASGVVSASTILASNIKWYPWTDVDCLTANSRYRTECDPLYPDGRANAGFHDAVAGGAQIVDEFKSEAMFCLYWRISDGAATYSKTVNLEARWWAGGTYSCERNGTAGTCADFTSPDLCNNGTVVTGQVVLAP